MLIRPNGISHTRRHVPSNVTFGISPVVTAPNIIRCYIWDIPKIAEFGISQKLFFLAASFIIGVNILAALGKQRPACTPHTFGAYTATMLKESIESHFLF